MSKNNLKASNKAIKKTARKDIEASLITDLTAITGKFGIESKKATKIIASSAKKLAKSLAKEIKFHKASAPETPAPVEGAIAVSEPAPVAKVVKKKVAPVKA